MAVNDYRCALLDLGRLIGGETILELRTSLLQMANDTDPQLSRAGSAWAGALGAALQICREPDADVDALRVQIERLMADGLVAWLSIVRRQAGTQISTHAENAVSVRTLVATGAINNPHLTAMRKIDSALEDAQRAISSHGSNKSWHRFDAHLERAMTDAIALLEGER